MTDIANPTIGGRVIEPDAILVLREAASLQSVGDGAVVLLADSGQLYTCNQTSEAFLKNIDGKRSFAEILVLFVAEFDVDEEIARDDLTDLCRTLMAEGILMYR